MNKMNTSRLKIKGITLFLMQIIVALFIKISGTSFTIRQMASVAIVQWLLSLILFKILFGIPLISIPNVFTGLVLLFNCGQLIMNGFGIKGSVPLPFQRYGNAIVVKNSFFFYLFAQLFCALAISIFDLYQINNSPYKGKQSNIDNTDKLCKVFLLFGFIPRIYIDIRSLIACLNKGYAGVYTLYFPQYIQTVAFFFDVGLVLLLFFLKNEKYKKRILFICVLLYKCIMMLSGARQDKVAFLLVWFYLFFFVTASVNIWKIIFLGVCGVIGMTALSVITYTRAGGISNISTIVACLKDEVIGHMIGNIMGEFGASFDTLEIVMNFVPEFVPYGLGKSYLAGLLSVVPLLVSHISPLSKYSFFLQLIPGRVTYAMGGSFLGEFYFNFSWIGLLGCVVLGFVLYRLYFVISNTQANNIQKAWNSIVLIELILFVRGYFTDMVQKLVWVYILFRLCDWYFTKRSHCVQNV